MESIDPIIYLVGAIIAGLFSLLAATLKHHLNDGEKKKNVGKIDQNGGDETK